MPVELLVHSFDHSKAIKGTIQDARDVSDLPIRPWGRKEGLPNYVLVRITDLTKAGVAQYLRPVKNKYRVVETRGTGRTRVYTISMKDNRVLEKFGKQFGTTLAIIPALDSKYDVKLDTLTPVDTTNETLTIEATDATPDELAAAVLDKFQEVVVVRRYHLLGSDVDRALAAGGSIEVIAAEVIPNIVDRLV